MTVSKTILKNSANKKGFTPSSIIGLSQPIKLPNHKIPSKQIEETDKINLVKINKQLSFDLIKDDKKQADKNPIK